MEANETLREIFNVPVATETASELSLGSSRADGRRQSPVRLPDDEYGSLKLDGEARVYAALDDEMIDRIARRVVELLLEGNPQGDRRQR